MSDSPNPNVQPSDELRHQVHMAMLEKSESAIHLKDLTVVPLGFAVTIAMEYIDAETNKAVITELNEARKWSTKADTADQVWQQLTDRINQLEAQQAGGNTDV